jgi:hypothetical protein
VALIKSRHTGAQRDAKLPFKRRDTHVGFCRCVRHRRPHL